MDGHDGVAGIHSASGRMYGVNGTKTFRAASVNKLPILLSLYDRAAKGRMSLDQVFDHKRCGYSTL